MIFTAVFWESMRGGPIPGLARLTGSDADLVSEVSVANVSLNRGMSGKSLYNGSDIHELVRTSHNWSSSAELDDCVDCGAPCWRQGCQCGSKSNTLCNETLRIVERKIRTSRER